MGDRYHLPLYWFPRDCPRGTWWAGPDTSAADAAALLLHTDRVHAIQADWLAAMQQMRVVAYRLPSETFEPDPEVGGYWISTETVEPLDVVVLDDLVGRHEQADIELRIVPDLAALWQQVIASTVEFSGMRLRNLSRSSDEGAALPGKPGTEEDWL